MTISVQYAAAFRAWVEADSRARSLEHMKEPTLWRMAKQRMAESEGLTITAAERDVKSSLEWEAYIVEMDDARTVANTAYGEVNTLLMKHEEALGGPSRIRLASSSVGGGMRE